jgi:hypothetical protein
MRGKLRDKRTTTKRDISKREGMERRRPSKRDNRSMVRFNLQTEDENFEFDIEDEEYEDEEEEEKIEVPQKK